MGCGASAQSSGSASYAMSTSAFADGAFDRQRRASGDEKKCDNKATPVYHRIEIKADVPKLFNEEELRVLSGMMDMLTKRARYLLVNSATNTPDAATLAKVHHSCLIVPLVFPLVLTHFGVNALVRVSV